MKPRIVFLGTPDFAAEILEALLKKELFELAAVWTRAPKPKGRGLEVRDSRLMELAKSLGVPCFTSGKLSAQDEDQLRELKVDIGLIIAYGQILKASFFEIPTYGTFNLHFSLLPKFRGASPVPSAILSGDEETGVSLQKIVKELDAGDLALSSRFPIEEKTAPEIFLKSIEESIRLFEKFFLAAPESFNKLTPQDHAQASFCQKMEKTSGKITDAHFTSQVLRMIRAYEPWPGVFVEAGDKRFQILKAKKNENVVAGLSVGTLARNGKKELLIVLADGQIIVEKIKPEGKKEMAVGDFLNSQPMDLVLKLKS